MAIKSELIETNRVPQPKLLFPCLRKHLEFGFVVAFTDAFTGVIILIDSTNVAYKQVAKDYPLFFRYSNWSNCNNLDDDGADSAEEDKVWEPVEELTVHYHE